MKKILIIFVLVFVLTGCASSTKIDINKLMQENEYVILDVRTEDEYNESHLVDSRNIPYDEINEEVELSKEKIIFVYCRSGKRSKIAYDTLKKLGYTVYDLGAFDTIDLPKE